MSYTTLMKMTATFPEIEQAKVSAAVKEINPIVLKHGAAGLHALEALNSGRNVGKEQLTRDLRRLMKRLPRYGSSGHLKEPSNCVDGWATEMARRARA